MSYIDTGGGISLPKGTRETTPKISDREYLYNEEILLGGDEDTPPSESSQSSKHVMRYVLEWMAEKLGFPFLGREEGSAEAQPSEGEQQGVPKPQQMEFSA